MTQQFHFWVFTGEENEKTNSKRHMPLSPSAIFTVALLKIAEIWEQLMCPLMNEWTKKM